MTSMPGEAHGTLGFAKFYALTAQAAGEVIKSPHDPRSYETFEEQKRALRHAVFDSEHLQHHEEYITFWSEHDK